MKLVVNVSRLQQPLTGIGQYTLHLLNELVAHPDIEDIQAIGSKQWYDFQQLTELLRQFNQFSADVAMSQSVATWQRWKKYLRKVPGARAVKQRLQEGKAQSRNAQLQGFVYWEPNFILLPFLAPAVTTVHDLSHIRYPQFHPKDRVKLLHKNLQSSMERAQAIVAVSEFSRSEIVNNFTISESKVHVVRPGVDECFRQHHSEQKLAEIKAKYQLPDRFVLSVCTLEPRKNIAGLLRAYQQLPLSLRQDVPLVLVGANGWRMSQIEPIFKEAETSGSLRRLGYVCDQDMPVLYALAQLMAYPSFYEGFGMPVAEAMASGTPVLTSNVASMPEVGNGAAYLVDPHDPESIAAGLRDLISNDQKRQSMIEQGKTIAKAYSWQNSAKTLVHILTQAS